MKDKQKKTYVYVFFSSYSSSSGICPFVFGVQLGKNKKLKL